MTNTKITTTQLDFDQIKESLKTHLVASGEFNDYDFTGSVLNTILDLLAYNTHYNGLIANFSLNEAFITSAQLRSSVVAHAKPLGYLPTSITGAQATVNITVNNQLTDIGPLTLPKWTQFTATKDGSSYSFYNLEEATANYNSGTYVFSGVVLHQGVLRTKKFYVDGDQTFSTYVINDTSVDTATLEVAVRDGPGSSSTTAYTRPTSITDLDSDSNVYFLYEAPNGYYEITLGDGIVGTASIAGTIVEASYLASAGPVCNGINAFSTSAVVNNKTLSVAVTATAIGGAPRESIDSIRFNAPKVFATQDRAVTVNDYKSFIQSNVNYVETMNVWGGEKNVPKVYGAVYICIKPTGADALTEAQKTSLLTNVLNDRKIVTIDINFVDPEFEYLEVVADVRYNPAATSLTKQQLQSNVNAVITAYGTSRLTKFSSTFRKSNLVTLIDASDSAILSSDITVSAQRHLKPTEGALGNYTLDYTLPIAANTSAAAVVQSSAFAYTVDNVNYTAFLRNKANSDTLEIYRPSTLGGTVIIADNAGSIDRSNNRLSITFNPASYPDSTNGIKFTVKLANDNVIVPQRNMLLRIDTDKTVVAAIEDTNG